ncbi:unnamed protein product [Alternaria burnsii]|nr:unnamed protein product [Alternaria burnsii]
MLDPLIALGAVANVTQFVELAIKIFARSHAIYNSANGSLDEYDDLGKVSEDISVLSTKLQESLTTTAAISSLTTDEQALCDLCKGCIDVSQELAKALEKLTGPGKPGRFRSFRQALKSVWSKDDIDNLERRVRMYKEELNIRIIVGLRSKIDVVALQQSEGFASLADETKSVIQSLVRINDKIQNGFERQHAILDTLQSRTETSITAYAKQDKEEHEKLSSQITELSQQSGDQSDRALGAQIDTRTAIEMSIDQNIAEHNKTREEMNRLKEQAERQIEVLTEEIRQLKIELEASVKTIVASLGTASKKEEQKLKAISNAKFNLWVAKELILEKLKAFVAMFRFSFATEIWTNTTDLKSWKLMPYPKPSEESPTGTMFTYSGIAGAGEESMAYVHVDLNYPIAARNVPMVKMCLDQGVDVNAKFPMANSSGMTPLMKAVDTPYETTRYDTIGTTLLMRRDARRIVQMLLDHGADKSPEARDLAKDTRGSKHQPDWLIKELLAPSPHPKLRQFISLTDAVWDGEQEKLEDMLTQEPDLWSASEFQGVSPLGAAIHRNDERMVSMLLGRGASPHALDPMGSSPLAIAVASNLEIMAKILLQYGANMTSVDPFLELNPFDFAVKGRNHTMCGTLLGNETTLNPSEKKKLLSEQFALAISGCYTKMAEILLEHGADVFMGVRPCSDSKRLNCLFDSYQANRKDQDQKTTSTTWKYFENPRKAFESFEEDLFQRTILTQKLLNLVNLEHFESFQEDRYQRTTSTPRKYVENHRRAYECLYTPALVHDLLAILKQYENRSNEERYQKDGMSSYDSSQWEDLISID